MPTNLIVYKRFHEVSASTAAKLATMGWRALAPHVYMDEIVPAVMHFPVWTAVAGGLLVQEVQSLLQPCLMDHEPPVHEAVWYVVIPIPSDEQVLLVNETTVVGLPAQVLEDSQLE